MHGAGFGIGLVPSDRLQPLGADNRARDVGAVGQVVAEIVVAVDDPHHVVVRSLLGLHRNLRLDLLVARVEISCPWRQVIDLVVDNLAAEARGGTLHHGDIVLILRRVAADHEPARPFLPDEILRERVGAHRIIGNDVEHVLAAQLLPERRGARTDVHDHRVLGLRQICHGDEIGRLQIGDDEGVAVLSKFPWPWRRRRRLPGRWPRPARRRSRPRRPPGSPLSASGARPGCLYR